MRRDHPGVARWRTLADSIDPTIIADPFWPRLATHLDDAARAGADIPALLREAITTHGPLPDELPAAALWWRPASTLAPATLQQSNTRLRPAWTGELHRIFGSTAAETIVADPGWPSLVAAVAACDWEPAQLLDTAAEHLLDLLADGSDIRPDEYTRLLTYRIELFTHHASRLDRDVPHAADDLGHDVGEPQPDLHDYDYGREHDEFSGLDFDAPLTERPVTPPQRVDIAALRVRRDAARAKAAALRAAILGSHGGPAERAAATELADLYARHQVQRPYLAEVAHTHADWVHADTVAEAHRYRLEHLAALARVADAAGDTALAQSYRDRHQYLDAATPSIAAALTNSTTARDQAHAALIEVAGGADRIVTDHHIHARRLHALDADAAELNIARTEARDLDNQLRRAEASAARAFAQARTAAAGHGVDIARLRTEVECLEAAGVSGAGMYPPPADGYAAVPEPDRAAVAAVAAGAQSVLVLTVGEGADKDATLTGIAAAARGKGQRILALPATPTAKAFYDAHPYADAANTPQIACEKFRDGRWIAPAGTLIVVDDAEQLTAEQLRCFTDNATATNTKLLLVTTPGSRGEPAQTLVDALATNLPWAQHIGAVPDRTPTTAICQARHLAATNPELGDPANRQQALDLLARRDTITRAYHQQIAHRSTERTEDRHLATGLEL
jgi:hypothetical protein